MGEIWRQEVVPAEMTKGVIVMIYKNKGSADDWAKYRTICLLPHALKVMSTILLRRVVIEIEDYLPEHQAAYRKGRSCRDNVYILAQLIDEAITATNERRPSDSAFQPTITFLDYVAAFDSVSHSFLDYSLHAAGCSVKSIAMCRAMYANATACVRGENGNSRTFPVKRGVLQGEVFSATAFVLAVQTICLAVDERSSEDGLPLGLHGVCYRDEAGEWVTPPGMPPPIRVKLLSYADDIAQISSTRSEASERATNICKGSLGTTGSTDPPAPCLVAHRIKTEAMQLSTMTCDQEISETDVDDCDFEHTCETCGRGFSRHAGLLIHQTRWSCKMTTELHRPDYRVDKVMDVRGTEKRRFYLVKWQGTNDTGAVFKGNAQHRHYFGADDIDTQPDAPWRPTWEPASQLDCDRKITDFWALSGLDPATTYEENDEHRCGYCGYFAATAPGLKIHQATCKDPAAAARTGSRTKEDVLRLRLKELHQHLPRITMDNTDLPAAFDFPYLGHLSTADGTQDHNIRTRLAMAQDTFSSLHHLWRDDQISVRLKISLYNKQPRRLEAGVLQ